MLPKLQNNLYTLIGCGFFLGKNSSQGMTMGEGRRKDYKDFSLEDEYIMQFPHCPSTYILSQRLETLNCFDIISINLL